jgi:hypothetical protein
MTCPTGRPIAQPQSFGKPRSETPSGGDWQPTLSAAASRRKGAVRPDGYITDSRLDQIAGQLGERDWQVITFLAENRLATGYQLTRFVWGTGDQSSGGARAARRALKRMGDARVLERLPRQVGGARGGSAGMVYAVGLAGTRLLARHGFQIKRIGSPGERHVDHALAVTEMLVRLNEAGHAGELDLIEVQPEPACWRAFLGPFGGRQIVKPDLFARVGVGAFEDRWMLEVDLATEGRGALVRKVKGYLAHFRSGVEQAEHGSYPRILWGVPTERRCELLGDVLRAQAYELRAFFAVCLLPDVIQLVAAEARA